MVISADTTPKAKPQSSKQTADSMLAAGSEGYIKKVDLSKLATHEDPYHVHKTLGILSLLHFFYRYLFVLPTAGNLGFSGTTFDCVAITMHLALSSTSLIFHVIKSRKLKFPMIMWNEYRLHAIVFTLRCWSVFVVAFALQRSSAFSKFSTTLIGRFSIYGIVMAHHVLADLITKWYGTPGVTSVRVAKSAKTGKVKYEVVKKFYSFYQFLAVASHISPNARLMDLGFNTLIAIQSSAFLMTLCRKNIITFRTHGVIYTTCLLLSTGYIARAMCSSGLLHGAFLISAAVAVFAARISFRLDKYLLWGAFVMLTHSPALKFFHREALALSPLATLMIDFKAPLSLGVFGLDLGSLSLAVLMGGVMFSLLNARLNGTATSSTASGDTGSANSPLRALMLLAGFRSTGNGNNANGVSHEKPSCRHPKRSVSEIMAATPS